MIAVDTSVVVAAFAVWHESHDAAVAVMRRKPRLPAPCALEAFAVLTRLPPEHRAPAALVRDYLEIMFAGAILTMPEEVTVGLVDTLVRLGIEGGASYDAAVGLLVRAHGATLVTLDRRARPTYERIGVTIRFLAP